MKKSGVIILLVISVLLISMSFVSANWFTDLFGVTGKGIVTAEVIKEFGFVGTNPVSADYDGDGKADLAVYCGSNCGEDGDGTWYIMQSSAGFRKKTFGWNGPIPAPADYDGDGKADMAVYDLNNVEGKCNPGDAAWYIEGRSGVTCFGWSKSIPAPADYDGDGKADITVYDREKGKWYIMQSKYGFIEKEFGGAAADPVPADYDGDGKADLAVYCGSNCGEDGDSTWYIQQSTSGFRKAQFGWAGASPAPADFNGDNLADIAVYNPIGGKWYIQMSVAPEPVAEGVCTDSDGGLDYYVKGSCIDSGGDLDWDSCVNGKLHEMYCTPELNCNYQEYNCPNGCSDGACINISSSDGGSSGSSSSAAECIDSDGGRDIYVKGTTTRQDGIQFTDTCTDVDPEDWNWDYNETLTGKVLEENFCNEWGDHQEDLIGCRGTCSDGVCVKQVIPANPVCGDLISKIINPNDFQIEDNKWRFSWLGEYSGDWWINGKNELYQSYSASWDNNIENKNYYIDQEIIIFNNKNIDLSSWLKERTSYDICTVRSFWANGKNNIVYVCNWDALRNRQDTDNYQHEQREVIWTQRNVIVESYISTGEELEDEEVIKLIGRDTLEFIEKLKDNEEEYIGWEYFEFDWQIESVIINSLNDCPSEIIEEEVCTSSWNCKLEPVICPPHGYQTQTCVQYCDKKENVRTSDMDCSPGICSGCYTPRWTGSRDNVCIPYGIRLIFDEGEEGKIYQDELNREFRDYDTGNKTINIEINEDETMFIEVLEDYEEFVNARIIVDGVTYNLEKGETFTVRNGLRYEVIIEDDAYGGSWTYDISILNINYDEDPEKAYIEIRMNRGLPSYCDYDGRLKQQKTRESFGGRIPDCQNDYECESNTCSSGECIEIRDIVAQASGLKGFFFKLVCRLANPISDDEYNQCLFELLGETP